ncbi:GldG family protein [Methylobacter psychrophilus]|uniref:GldG family protein n=1 Tax=Methylobacter psychrophilus TaxID=96941 RepID=UPI0021D4DC06|nr:GldG family protein [Methylobacter psychrophilus]
MKLSPRIHQQLRLKSTLVTALLLFVLGTLAFLTTRYSIQTDITNNAGNTLSQASQKLLLSLPDKVTVTAYIKQGQPIRTQIAQLVDRYSRYKANLTLNFIDPDFEPEKTRELNIGPEGIIIVDYQERTEKLTFIDESSLTNALLQLTNANERWITFLTGHGERSPDGIANFDFGQFGKELAHRKINAQTLNLVTLPAIPDNSALLVIAAPKVALLTGEIAIIKGYIQRGGNLLVLTDPDNKQLTDLLKFLGIKQLDGIIVDSNSTLYGIDDPSFILVSEYAPHPVTKGFQTITLYPVVAALEIDGKTDFTSSPLLSSSAKSWTETGAIKGKIRFDANGQEKQGPLAFAYALTRNFNKTTQQRIVVVGDGDFLSNAYLGNVGNLDMGLKTVSWLIHDDRFINIPAKIASDKSLQLTQTAVAAIGFGFLLIIPLVLIGTGFIIWHKRKQR